MLQRRIGMIWTRRGCAVCVRPRMNSRRERALRLRVLFTDPCSIASGHGRLRWAQAPNLLADFQRSIENRSDRDDAEQLMTRDGCEPRRRDAAAVGAIRRPTELARRDLRLEVRGDRRGGIA